MSTYSEVSYLLYWSFALQYSEDALYLPTTRRTYVDNCSKVMVNLRTAGPHFLVEEMAINANHEGWGREGKYERRALAA